MGDNPLQKHFVILCQELDVERILPYLKAERMVTSDEYETLTNNAFTTRQKLEKLLLLLPRKGREYFRNFGKCLVWSGQTDLARHIGIDLLRVPESPHPAPPPSGPQLTPSQLQNVYSAFANIIQGHSSPSPAPVSQPYSSLPATMSQQSYNSNDFGPRAPATAFVTASTGQAQHPNHTHPPPYHPNAAMVTGPYHPPSHTFVATTMPGQYHPPNATHGTDPTVTMATGRPQRGPPSTQILPTGPYQHPNVATATGQIHYPPPHPHAAMGSYNPQSDPYPPPRQPPSAAHSTGSVPQTSRQPGPPRVFILYCKDTALQNKPTEEFCDDVLALSDILRYCGIEGFIDQYKEHQANWDMWTQEMIMWSDYVLMVCSPTLSQSLQSQARITVEMAKGKFFNHSVMNYVQAPKFIPIFLDNCKPRNPLDWIPPALRMASIWFLNITELSNRITVEEGPSHNHLLQENIRIALEDPRFSDITRLLRHLQHDPDITAPPVLNPIIRRGFTNPVPSSSDSSLEAEYISVEDLRYIAERLPQDWQHLGIMLGLEYLKLEELRTKYPFDKTSATLEMFRVWQSKKGKLATRKALKKALNDLNYGLLVKEIFGDDRDGIQENVDDKDFADASSAGHINAIQRAIKNRGKLKHKLAHGVFAGPARSGKSSLITRLTSDEMPDTSSPSTGVAEQVVQVGMRKSYSIALGVYGSIWFKLQYAEEARRFLALASPSVSTESLPIASTTENILPQSDVFRLSPSETHSATSQASKQNKMPKLVNAYQNPGVSISMPEGYVAPKGVFESAVRGNNLEELNQLFENSWSLYLTDAGGQMEFQEILPVLVSGPSVYFITFCLHQDLNQRFTIEYHLPDGGRSKPYQSTLTVMDAILQTLASIASMGTFTYRGTQMESFLLRPKAVIVGTHKDLLDPATADSDIKKIDSFIQSVIKNTAHYQQDLIEFASDSQLIFTVDNFSKDDSDFRIIRSAVERIVCRRDFEVTFPSNWLIFSHVLRQKTMQDSVISYDQCFAVAQDCGIVDHEELNHALWFLHTKIGLIRHFPTPALRNVVIRHPQILFDMVTELIVNTFTFENVNKRCSNEFQQKGIFSLEDFKIIHKSFTPLLPPEKLLQLLEHLRIIAPFKDNGQEKYFIPCVLAHSERAESQSSPQNSSDIPPLLITFKCGYCPKGLAGALIVYLLTNEVESNLKCELLTEHIFRDQVSFEVSPFDAVTLKIYPTHLQIVHSCVMARSASKVSQKVENVCDSVRVLLENGISNVSGDMNLTQKAAHSFSFFCRNPECSLDVAHPATEISGSFCNLCCKKSGKRLHSPLPEGFTVWFGKAKEGTSELNKTDLEQSNKNPALRDAFRLLLPLAFQWHNIGVFLISNEELNTIKKDNPGDSKDCLRVMLDTWLKCIEPQPTWTSLAEAVEPFDPRKAEEIRKNYSQT